MSTSADHRRRRQKQHRWRVLAVLVLVPAALVLVPAALSRAAGEAAASSQYAVSAAADGVRVSVLAQDFLLVDDLLDAGIPSAQAVVDSLGNSSGFASNPYPGATVLSVPPLASGAFGQQVPDYPLHAASRHPTKPESKVEHQGYSLSSKSTETSTEAAALADLTPEGGDAGRSAATATSTVDPATGAATAKAISDTQSLTINGVLQLGRVHSTATVTSKPDGKLTRSSELSIADTRVAGQRVAITPEGVRAAGQTAGLPSSDQVTETLKQAGVSVRYLAAEKGPNGIVSAGIEVIAKRKDPTEGSSATVTVRYVFGRASAAAGGSAEELPGPAPLDSGQDHAGAPQAASESGDAPTSEGTAAPEAAPAAASGPAPADAPPPALADRPAEQPAALLMARPGDLGGMGIYVTLVFVALATFAGGTLLRLLGVRTRWMS